jgi:hypothetical protein
MKQSPAWQSLPPDSTERPALLIFFVSLASVCVALFGERLPMLYLGISAGCSLVLAFIMRLQRSVNTGHGFTLDDETRSLKPHNARPIAFGSIAAFRLVLYRDCACVHVMCGMLRRRRNLACVPRNESVQDILQTLRDRSFVVKLSRNPFKKRTAELLPLMIMPLLAAAILYVNIDMLRQVPCLALPPQQLRVESSAAPAKNQTHRLGPVSLSLPREYRLLRQPGQISVFYNPQGDVRLTLDSGPPHATVPDKPFLQAVAGVLGFGNDYEAAMLAVRSRFGLLPALIKSALLKNYAADTVRIYRVSAGALTGVMLRGEQARPGEDGLEHMPDQVTEIMLRSNKKDPVIRMLIASRMPLDIEHIRHLIAGIH